MGRLALPALRDDLAAARYALAKTLCGKFSEGTADAMEARVCDLETRIEEIER